MFKKQDKQNAPDTESKSNNGSFNSPSERMDNVPSSTSGNFRGVNRYGTSVSSRSATSSTGTQPGLQPSDTVDPFSFWDTPTNGATTMTNQLPSTSNVSGSTLSRAALQSAYGEGAASATTVANQIVADKKEVVSIIANYAVEPSEMLHLVDRWLQQLLREFKEQRDHFKHRLSEKWQNEELTNITYDNNDRIRGIYSAYKELERARDTILSRESFEDLNNYLRQIDDSATDNIKQRFNSLSQDYLRILHRLEFVDRETKMISRGGDNYISDIKKNLSKLIQLNNKPSHTICIVGLEKAGKSTFINALIGHELLPTAAERCTQVRTVLKPPIVVGDQQVFASVKFYDDEEFRVFYDKMTKKTDESQQQFDERKREVAVAREALKVKFPEELFRINNCNDVDNESAAICVQLYDYITGEVYCNIIKEISIYTDRLPGRNYELLDVPGFDSPIIEHRNAGLEAIRTADAFLFLTNGQQPSLTHPQIQLLQEIQENHFEAMQRAFGIITKLDLCHTPAIYQDRYDKAYNELIEKRFKQEHIYVACPRMQIIDRNSEEHHNISLKLKSFGNNVVDGFDRSKKALNKFIEYELPKTHLKQLVELGRMRLVQSVLERLDQIKEKQLLPQNLGDTSIDEYIQQQKTESWDRVYADSIFKPAFAKANEWHTTIVTKERAAFIDDVRQTFHNAFLERTKQFLQSTQNIEQRMFEGYDYSKIQLNPHEIDNGVRRELSFKLEKIVDETSDVLSKYFYHRYICGLQNILNDVCPHLKDLYRPQLTLEKCTNETHALILRVCRPVIAATLRYSHLDPTVKMDAVKELIYIAPTVAYNIANSSDRSGIVGIDIHKSVEILIDQNEMTTLIIRTLFKK